MRGIENAKFAQRISFGEKIGLISGRMPSNMIYPGNRPGNHQNGWHNKNQKFHRTVGKHL